MHAIPRTISVRSPSKVRFVRTRRMPIKTVLILSERIFANRRYIGEYAYKEIVVPNAIPAIVSKDIFERVAIRMKQNKHATGKAKASERYLLTTKLFCGTCQSMFVGDSAQTQRHNIPVLQMCKC